MNFNDYDILKINTTFIMEEGREYTFDSGIQGVIAQSRHSEYLMEFKDENNKTHHVLIEK